VSIFDNISARDGITIAVAVFGAILSTFTFVQGYIKGRRRVRIDISEIVGHKTLANVLRKAVVVRVINFGSRPVTARMPMLEWSNGERIVGGNLDKDQIYFDRTGFPVQLNDGESAGVYVDLRNLARLVHSKGHSGKVTLRPLFFDQTQKKYLGRKWVFDSDDEYKDNYYYESEEGRRESQRRW
jgi:hypothetical protein